MAFFHILERLTERGMALTILCHAGGAKPALPSSWIS